MIFRAGIKRFYYVTAYRSIDGVGFLERAGVFVCDLGGDPIMSSKLGIG